jgi:outer membrane protein assembly factor BamB
LTLSYFQFIIIIEKMVWLLIIIFCLSPLYGSPTGSTTTYIKGIAQVLETTSGTLVLFYKSDNYQMKYIISTTEGKTWGESISIGASYWRSQPATWIDGTNNIYLVYRDANSESRLNFKKLTYAGSNTWTEGAEYQVEDGTTLSSVGNELGIYREPGGRIWVCYPATLTSGAYVLYVRYSDDDGVSWSSPEDIYDGTLTTEILTAKFVKRKGVNELYCFGAYYGSLQYSYWNGTTWSPISSSIGTPGDKVIFDVVSTDDGYLHVFWNYKGKGNYRYYTGTTWSTTTEDIEVGSRHGLGLATDGKFLWVLTNRYPDNNIIISRRWNGTDWDPEDTIIEKDVTSRSPVITLKNLPDNPTYIPAIYLTGSSSPYTIKFGYSHGPLWKWPPPGESAKGAFRSAPRVYNNTIYLGSDDGYFYAIDIRSQTLKWSYYTGTGVQIRSSPWFYIENKKPIIFFGASNGKLYKLRDDGSAAYDFSTEGWPITLSNSPLSAGPITNINCDKVFIGGEDGKIYGLDVTTGNALPGFPVSPAGGNGFVATAAYYLDDLLYIGDTGGVVYAIEPTTGNILRSYDIGTAIRAPITLRFNDITNPSGSATIYIGDTGSTNGGLFALAASDFSVRGNYSGMSIDNRVRASVSPYGWNNKIYFLSSSHSNFYCVIDNGAESDCLSIASGYPLPLGGVSRSAPVGWGKYLFWGGDDKKVYCLNPSASPLRIKSGWPRGCKNTIETSPALDLTNRLVIIASTEGRVYVYPIP